MKGGQFVIVYRVEVRVRPDQLDQARELFTALAAASRVVPGVVAFDILADPVDPARFVSCEVYRDQAALDAQGALPELEKVMAAFPRLLTGPPDGTKFFVHASEPWPAPAGQ